MSKYDIGVGDDFPLEDGRLNESDQQDGCGGHHGRHHRHHHHRGHHHGHHHAHHYHDHGDHHRDRMAVMAMLFALKAWRHRMRHPTETL